MRSGFRRNMLVTAAVAGVGTILGIFIREPFVFVPCIVAVVGTLSSWYLSLAKRGNITEHIPYELHDNEILVELGITYCGMGSSSAWYRLPLGWHVYMGSPKNWSDTDGPAPDMYIVNDENHDVAYVIGTGSHATVRLANAMIPA